MHGLLVLDKPVGPSSREVVDRVLRWFPKCKAGHAGTLDPLASGVLVICLGQATRLLEYVQEQTKVYETSIRLGATSATDDAEGPIAATADAEAPAASDVQLAVAAMVGTIEQVPPSFSAARVAGRRAYKLARKGHTVALAARTVTIHALDVLSYAYPDLTLRITCGKGTYVRSLARDLGQRLGCGGYVDQLARIQIGHFLRKEAISLEASAKEALDHVLPVEAAVCAMPRLTLTGTTLTCLCHGQIVPYEGNDTPQEPTDVAIFNDQHRLAAIAHWQAEQRILLPKKILLPSPANRLI